MTRPSFQERNARTYPPNYRKEIIPNVMDLLGKGESCFIVGASGTGKSNLFRCICHPDTKERYLPDRGQDFAFVWADTNGLAGELSAFYLYELILYHLLKWAEEQEALGISAALFQKWHEAVVLSKDRVLAQRHLESALRYVFNQVDNFHLTLLFDEFEPIAQVLDFQFFRNLRWLRDEFKYHLCYVMAAYRTPMAIRREFFDKGEPFYELLAANILGLKPYNPEDSHFMLSEMSNRYEFKVQPPQQALILQLSGGHGGLIGAIFRYLLKNTLPHTAEAQIEQLLAQDSIAGECRKIWNSLEALEQDVLLQWRNNNFVVTSPVPVSGLIAKGILVQEGQNQMTAFSPLFQRFLQMINIDQPISSRTE